MPSPDEIRSHLSRLLASPEFVKAGRLGPFLSFLIENTLNGKAEILKEPVIGVEVFQRATDYDPRIDPIVRVEARRLRTRLEKYYSATGAHEPLRIDLPKGTYVPEFRTAATKSATSRRMIALSAVVCVVLCVALILVAPSRRRLGPHDGRAASLAVMPFVDLSQSKDQEHLCDGIAEELIHALTQAPGVRVVARSSAFQYKGQKYDVRKVGRALGVNAVVEGSVRTDGDRLRVTARLVDTAGGYQLWSRAYERRLADVFTIQDEITASIANTLEIDLGAERQPPRTPSIDAYNSYLRGRHHLNLHTVASVRRSIEYFEQSAAEDPQFAGAYAGLGAAYQFLACWRAGYRAQPSHHLWPKAQAELRKAISLDASLAEAHALLGSIAALYDWNLPEAKLLVETAMALNPSSGEIRALYAVNYLFPLGLLDQAEGELRRALQMEPLSTGVNYATAGMYFRTGDYESAITQFQRTLELSPDFSNIWSDLAECYAFTSQGDKALEAYARMAELRGITDWDPGAFEHATLGELDEARRRVAVELRDSDYRRPWEFARIFAMVGENDRAFAYLEKAYEERESQLIWIRTTPHFRPLQDDPRFADLLTRIGADSGFIPRPASWPFKAPGS